MKVRDFAVGLAMVLFAVIPAQASLENAINALQICTGIATTPSIGQVDVNGDDAIGLEEAIFALQETADVRIIEYKIIADDGGPSDRFGRSVSIDGDYAIVGAHQNDGNDIYHSGSAYIFQRNGATWLQQAKLTAGDGAFSDFFGASVSINGDYAIVGAYGDDDNGTGTGSAYIFQRSGATWLQQAKLTASDGQEGDRFGYSVSINGDYAIVGGYRDDDNGADSGSAYIFQRSGATWLQQAKLTADDGAFNDFFGHSVSINGDYAIVGACGDDDNGTDSGSVYVFRRSGPDWIQQTKLTASDGQGEDYFGHSVSINGDYAIVGAYGDDDNGYNSGSAYIFQCGAIWLQQAKLTASDGDASDHFGHSVSINGDYAIVGANRDENVFYLGGSAYIFQRGGATWLQNAKLTASDENGGHYFGCSVSVNGDYAIVGEEEDAHSHGLGLGSAYIYDLTKIP